MSEPTTEPAQKPFLGQYTNVIALVAVVIVVPSLIINCVTLYQWATDASGPVLTVSARANAFAIPPTPPIPNGYDPAEMFGEYKTYVTLTLKNTGDLPADNVRVVLPRFGDLPASGRFRYERSDGEFRGDTFVSEFDIGTVEADQLIDVSFWTSEELGETDQLTLSSKSGKEYVQLRNLDEIFGVKGSFWTVCAFVVVCAMTILFAWRSTRLTTGLLNDFQSRMLERTKELQVAKAVLDEQRDRLERILESKKKSQQNLEDGGPDDASPDPD